MAGVRPAWHGRWKSVAGLQRGDGWFHFPSFRPLQAGITSDSTSEELYTALGQLPRCSFGLAQVLPAALGPADRPGLCSLIGHAASWLALPT